MVLGSGAFGKWLYLEVGALMNRISAIKKETLESSFAPSDMWGYSGEMVFYEVGSHQTPDLLTP